MLRYHVTIALRNIARNKGLAVSNIIGFATGLAAFLLIVLFVADEWSYDKFNRNHSRIFRVDSELKYGGAVTPFAIAPAPVAEAMLQEFPEIDNAVRMEAALNIQLKKGNEVIQEDKAVYADPSIFDVFTLAVVEGNSRTALTDPAAVVVSESIAAKYFNSAGVVGRSLVFANDNSIHTITAVVKDMPRQSHFHADLFLPLHAQANSKGTRFTQFNFNTYVLLNTRSKAESVMEKLPRFIKKHLGNDMNVEAFEKGGNYINLSR